MQAPIKILLLEDFPPDVELIERELIKAGIKFNSKHVDNKADFIEAIQKFLPDLIISDYSLPQYDGLSAIRDLRALSPGTPIIIVTGSLDEETAADTIKSGAWDYVVKERLYRLPSAVNQALKLKQEIESKISVEKALQQTEDEYETLRNNIPLAIYRATVEGKLLYANPSFWSMFGYESIEEVMIKPMIEHYLHPEDRGRLMGKLVEEKVVRDFEIAFLRKDGSTFWGSVYGRALFNEQGDHIFQDGIIMDVSELKQTHKELISAKERAEESDNLKTAFLANMSHEIRTPMNAILGFSELLLDPYYSKEDVTWFVSLIHKNGKSLITIINDIIEVAKIEAGILQIEKSYCSLDTIFRELYETFRGDMSKKGLTEIDFSYTAPEEPGLRIYTDPNRLKQILRNLLSNAFKFTEHGRIEFGAQVVGANITFFVKDSGLGIPEDKFEIIFDRFRQVDDSHTREFGGTGIGLTIAKNLVERLDGTIWVESDLYKGSEFYFKLPFQPETQGESEIKDIPTSGKPAVQENWATKTILIVEDVESNYMYLETVLKKTKANILWADSGQKALDYIRTTPEIDIVLMDIQLPDLNGLGATRQIKEMRPELTVIAQTAFALSTDEEMVYNAGCDGYLTKPITKKNLMSCLSTYLH